MPALQILKEVPRKLSRKCQCFRFLLKKTAEEVRQSPREHVFRMFLQYVGVPTPQTSKEHFDMERLLSVEHVSAINFQHIEVPMVQVLKDIFKMLR